VPSGKPAASARICSVSRITAILPVRNIDGFLTLSTGGEGLPPEAEPGLGHPRLQGDPRNAAVEGGRVRTGSAVMV
jgi:hypothetical protein